MRPEKEALLFGPNQNVVEFADLLEFGLQQLVVLQPLFDLSSHLWPDAVLLGDAARVADRQYPSRVPAARCALGTACLVLDGALDQGTAQNLVGGGEASDQFIALAESLFLFH